MALAAAQALPSQPSLSDSAIAVRDALVAQGLETPMIPNALTRNEKYRNIKAYTPLVIS